MEQPKLAISLAGGKCLRQQGANNSHAAHGTCIICTPSVLLARSIKDWVNPLKSISSKHPPSVIRRAKRGKENTSHILEVDILNSCYATTRGNWYMYKVWCGTEYFRSSHAVSLCACRAPPSVPSLLSARPACARRPCSWPRFRPSLEWFHRNSTIPQAHSTTRLLRINYPLIH